MTKRVTGGDVRRIAETIENLDIRDDIVDKPTFDEAYDDYFEDNDYFINTPDIRKKVFKEYVKNNKEDKRDLFKRAGGRSFERDRMRTAREVVTTEDEYIKKGARNVDLKGYDTKRTKKDKQSFKYFGRSKNKLVYARKVFIVTKGKRRARYRDKRGRFVKLDKKR